MLIFVDIDKTICSFPAHTMDFSTDSAPIYKTAEPILENIAKVNKMYDQGHTIVFWTARGCFGHSSKNKDKVSNIFNLTMNQLKEWKVKFHEVRLGKPYFDILIDDRTINSITDWTPKRVEQVFEENKK